MIQTVISLEEKTGGGKKGYQFLHQAPSLRATHTVHSAFGSLEGVDSGERKEGALRAAFCSSFPLPTGGFRERVGTCLGWEQPKVIIERINQHLFARATQLLYKRPIYTLRWAFFHLSNDSHKKHYQSYTDFSPWQLCHSRISTPEMQLLWECKRDY